MSFCLFITKKTNYLILISKQHLVLAHPHHHNKLNLLHHRLHLKRHLPQHLHLSNKHKLQLLALLQLLSRHHHLHLHLVLPLNLSQQHLRKLLVLKCQVQALLLKTLTNQELK